MAALTIDRQRRRDSVPRRLCGRCFPALQDSQFTDFVQVRDFQSLVRDPFAEPLDLVTDSELMFRMGSRPNSNPKPATVLYRGLHSQ